MIYAEENLSETMVICSKCLLDNFTVNTIPNRYNSVKVRAFCLKTNNILFCDGVCY